MGQSEFYLDKMLERISVSQPFSKIEMAWLSVFQKAQDVADPAVLQMELSG